MRLLFRITLFLAAQLNRRQASRLAKLFGRLLARSELADVCLTNLAVCFPNLSDSARNELVRQRLGHMSLLFFELAQLRFWSQERLLQDVTVVGRDELERAISRGKGSILLVPHLGNWELMCVYLGHHYSLAALYDPPKVGGLEAEIKTARERFAGKMYAIGIGGMRSILKELRQGGLVAVLPDQVPERDSGVYAPFYGHPALTMTLPYQLMQKTASEVLIGSVCRTQQGNARVGYTLTFKRLAVEDVSSAEAMGTLINRAIELEISQAPEQYQWEYKRFKRPPEGGNIYRRQ